MSLSSLLSHPHFCDSLRMSAGSHSKKDPDNSRRAEQRVWGQASVRPTLAAAFMSVWTRTEVRATPLSEMARWKRFLARGDNTWEEGGEKGSLCSQEGVFKSHPHPQPCPGLFPWRPWGPASARKPQLEGARSRVKDKTGSVWHTLIITIKVSERQLSNS